MLHVCTFALHEKCLTFYDERTHTYLYSNQTVARYVENVLIAPIHKRHTYDVCSPESGSISCHFTRAIVKMCAGVSGWLVGGGILHCAVYNIRKYPVPVGVASRRSTLMYVWHTHDAFRVVCTTRTYIRVQTTQSDIVICGQQDDLIELI